MTRNPYALIPVFVRQQLAEAARYLHWGVLPDRLLDDVADVLATGLVRAEACGGGDG